MYARQDNEFRARTIENLKEVEILEPPPPPHKK
jgi:hypothetical protein